MFRWLYEYSALGKPEIFEYCFYLYTALNYNETYSKCQHEMFKY